MNRSVFKYKPAVIIPAYRREQSLSRLLQSVNDAHYPDSDIKLIISLDQGASAEVIKCAKNFVFKHGSVQVIEHSEKLGLKDHIIKCADFALEFGSIIVLEEDLIVAPGFYNYTQKALHFYSGEERVTGISLYSQRFNESAQLPFEPLETEYSAYFMKLVCSWGQAWTSAQWSEFKEWYSKADASVIEQTIELPDNVKKWSMYSWKKFFDAYMLKSDKYFLYPYSSFSTHCGDEKGEHIKEAGNLFQVPLTGGDPQKTNFEFPDFKTHLIKYDMHMEPSGEFINSLLALDSNKIAVDLYGTKSIKQLKGSDYILSSKKIKGSTGSFPLQFKPLEMNMKFESYDEELPFFYLYKTENLNDLNFEKPNRFRFAKYFSYQNFFSRKVIGGFFKHIFKMSSR